MEHKLKSEPIEEYLSKKYTFGNIKTIVFPVKKKDDPTEEELKNILIAVLVNKINEYFLLLLMSTILNLILLFLWLTR